MHTVLQDGHVVHGVHDTTRCACTCYHDVHVMQEAHDVQHVHELHDARHVHELHDIHDVTMICVRHTMYTMHTMYMVIMMYR